VKQYFPEPKVLEGLFRVIEGVFGVTSKPTRTGVAPGRALLPHRQAPAHGELVGQFYLDLYARETKRGGAWMDEAITRRRSAQWRADPGGLPQLQLPGARWAANSGHLQPRRRHHPVPRMRPRPAPPADPVEELPVSGIHGVEWDAVELPSQFMENFCWEWDVLQGMTGHAETGEPLPRALYDKMIAAKNFQSGLQTLRQVEFGLFDLRIHSDFCTSGTTHQFKQVLDDRAQGSGGAGPARVEPLPAELLAHLRRRLCGGLLQLQVGRSAVRRRLRSLRGSARRPGAPCSTPKPANATCAKSSRSAAHGRRWNPSRPSAAANPSPMPCCATTAWRFAYFGCLNRRSTGADFCRHVASCAPSVIPANAGIQAAKGVVARGALHRVG
jgi:hypothetical protein